MSQTENISRPEICELQEYPTAIESAVFTFIGQAWCDLMHLQGAAAATVQAVAITGTIGLKLIENFAILSMMGVGRVVSVHNLCQKT